MSMIFSEIICHFIWRIASDSDPMKKATCSIVEKFLEDKVTDLGYSPISIAVLEDHVHLLAMIQHNITPKSIVEDLKEKISKYLNCELAMQNPPIWNEGYGIVSVSKSHVDIVTEYLVDHKTRHRKGKINTTLERVSI